MYVFVQDNDYWSAVWETSLNQMRNKRTFIRAFPLYPKNILNSQKPSPAHWTTHGNHVGVYQGIQTSRYCMVIMTQQWSLYIEKLETMIEDGIKQGKYETTTDSTQLSDLNPSKISSTEISISKNSPTTLNYTHIHPVANHLAQLYTTAKPHRFEDHNQITTN